MALELLFRSFFQAGFECSTHRNRSGKRLDLLRSTRHDCLARQDYARIRALGIRTVRLAARWHVEEELAGQFDFRGLDEMLQAADEAGLEVLLDLLHFGWPDHVDVLSASFPDDFARYGMAMVRFLKQHHPACRIFAPVNEISFLSWAGGERGGISPHAVGRGHQLKSTLVRAAVRVSEILLNEIPGVRLISPEPVIHIIGNPEIPGDVEEAEGHTRSQFQTWDMLCGQMHPELGGRPEYLDIVGINFYRHNQWVHNTTTTLLRGDARYRPFHELVEEVWQRYRRPMFLAETGTEDDGRAAWLNHICDETDLILKKKIPFHGVCLYPILNHPGWDDERHCCNGLFDYPDENGHREIYGPLAEALENQQRRFAKQRELHYDTPTLRSDLPVSPEMGLRFPTAAALDGPVRT